MEFRAPEMYEIVPSTRGKAESRQSVRLPGYTRWPSPNCMSPIALPRCSAGQVSGTSTEPGDHSPPSPDSHEHPAEDQLSDTARTGCGGGKNRVSED